jgi:hypothetical protein
MVSVPTEGLPKVRCSICVDFNGHSLLDSSGVGANDFPKVHFAVLVEKDHVEFVLRLRIMHHLRPPLCVNKAEAKWTVLETMAFPQAISDFSGRLHLLEGGAILPALPSGQKMALAAAGKFFSSCDRAMKFTQRSVTHDVKMLSPVGCGSIK